MNLTRRQFIHSLNGVTLAALAGNAFAQSPVSATAFPLIEFHLHLFGIGDGGTGCWFSEKQKQHLNYRYLLRLLELKPNGQLDDDYEQRLVA